MKLGLTGVAGSCLLGLVPAQAQLLDLNPGFVVPEAIGAGGGYFTRVGTEVAFLGGTRDYGAVLCFSDGTAQGTRIVHSFPLHYGDTGHTNMFGHGNRLLFTLHRADIGRELWISDGTDVGTRLLREFQPGPADGLDFTTVFVEFQGLVWFAAADAAHGLELWRTDGTEAGTQLAADIWQGTPGSAPTAIEVSGGRLFLLAGDGAYGRELWVSDGTQAGTHMVADLSMYSDIANLMAIGSGVVFSTTERTYGNELFFSDGTAAGTIVLADLVPGTGGSNPRYVQRFGSELVFEAQDAQGVWRVFRTNGTPAGTAAMLPQWTWWQWFFPVTASGSTLFVWRPAANTGWELWRSDGTVAGSSLVLTTAPMNGYFNVWQAPVAGGLFAAFDDGVHGCEPWFIPSQGPPVFVGDLRPGSAASVTSSITVVGNEAWFPANDGVHGTEPWVWSPSAGARLVDVCPPLPSSSALPLCAIGEDLVLTARIDATTAGLFRSDGTLPGTVPLALWPPSANPATAPSAWTIAVDRLRTWFFYDDTVHGRELWVTDGTAEGTALVCDTTPGPGDTSVQSAVVLDDGRLLFGRYTSAGSDLWVSDGTSAGTIQLGSPFQANLICRASALALLAAYTPGASNLQLWRSDGTAAGTTLVSPSLDVTGMVGMGAYGLVFTRNAGLWRSDGTAAGTAQVLATAPGNGPGARCGDWYFFRGYDGQGEEPWRTDGTASGTYRLADIQPGAASSTANVFRAVAAMDRVFFPAQTPGEGKELWVTDGTSVGTQLVRDIMPGPVSGLGNARLLTGIVPLAENRRLLFLAEDFVRGEEFWTSDGTSIGTRLLADAAPGSASSWVQGIVRAGGRLYWQGFDPVAGYELWSMPLPTAGLAASNTFGSACALGNVAPRIAAVDVPRVGNPAFGFGLGSAPANSFAVLLWSDHRQDTQLGGCTLHPSLPAGLLVYVTAGTGSAFAPVPVPNDPGFVGLSLFAQWLVVAPGGPLSGLAVASDALHAIVGG